MPDWPSLLLGVAALIGHAAIWVGFINRLHAAGLHRWLVDGLTMLAFLALGGYPLALVLVLLGIGSDNPTLFGSPVLGQALGCYTTLCAIAAPIAVATRFYWRLHPERRVPARTAIEELDLAAPCGPGVVAAGLPRVLASLPGNQLLRLSVEHTELPIPNLPPKHDGLKIAMLSDLHMSGRLSIDYFRQVVERTQAWEPDLIALCGDLVERPKCLDWIDSTLARLHAPGGVWFVLGNHDERVEIGQLRQRLTAHSLRDVGGRSVETTLRGAPTVVCGNEAPWLGSPPQLPPADKTTLRLALLHGPDEFPWAVANGVHLALAGHTHGGQICMPGLGAIACPSRYGARYAAGLFRRGGTTLLVGRGTGSLAPLRYFCPPELTLLTLRSVSGA